MARSPVQQFNRNAATRVTTLKQICSNMILFLEVNIHTLACKFGTDNTHIHTGFKGSLEEHVVHNVFRHLSQDFTGMVNLSF